MACKSNYYVGKDVILEYAFGCGDALPAENEWMRVGSLTTKEFNLTWDTEDTTTDDVVGYIRENLATFQSLSISGTGKAKRAGAGADNLKALTKHVISPVDTGGQPSVWMRMTYPDLTFIAYMIVTDASRSGGTADSVEFNFEAQATSSDFGLIVEDTPDVDADDVTGVQVVPGTLSLTVGQEYTLQAVALPTNADQRVTWESDNPAEVSVNSVTGKIKALTQTASTAMITATSKGFPAISGSAVVTVS